MEQRTIQKVVATALAGGLGIWLALKIVKSLKGKVKLYQREKDICVIETPADWEHFHENKIKHKNIQVLGLDCEWVFKGKRHPVSMLQLATQHGSCALVRMCKLAYIPESLKTLLNDRKILKVGVAVKDDANKLRQDFGLHVCGCVDLRHVIKRIRGIYKCYSLGLQGMAEGVLGVHLSKNYSIRCGNWEADNLSQDQIEYAANDGIVAVDIFTHLVIAKLTGKNPNKSGKEVSLLAEESEFWRIGRSLCQGTVDVTYNSRPQGPSSKSSHNYRQLVKDLSEQAYQNNSAMEHVPLGDGESDSDEDVEKNDYNHSAEDFLLPRQQQITTNKASNIKERAYCVRKRPLYYNCALEAPDGQMLCTCDVRKAAWYIEKGLADKVQDNPLIVRLRFEPAGRPMGPDDYYCLDKENICVVCGKDESFIRKSIVPREYRRYFPPALKEHASHDVLLLCVSCHMVSTQNDTELRLKFEQECDAPIDSGSGIKTSQDMDLRKVKSAAKALTISRDQIPAKRLEELEETIKDFYGVPALNEEILKNAMEVDEKIINKDYVAHGKKVVLYMRRNGGLAAFEKLWRQHFIDTMKPKHMPKSWSVDHRHEHDRESAEYPPQHKVRNLLAASASKCSD